MHSLRGGAGDFAASRRGKGCGREQRWKKEKGYMDRSDNRCGNADFCLPVRNISCRRQDGYRLPMGRLLRPGAASVHGRFPGAVLPGGLSDVDDDLLFFHGVYGKLYVQEPVSFFYLADPGGDGGRVPFRRFIYGFYIL